MLQYLEEIDIECLRFIQQNRFAWLDVILYWVSFTTTFTSVLILLVLMYQGYRNKTRHSMLKFYQVLSTFLLAAIVSTIAKHVVQRPRPFVVYHDIDKLSEAGSYSFPSGHTTEAFVVAFGILFGFNYSFWAILVGAWALLVAYSRMALGVHYPSDVLVAVLLALIISKSTQLLTSRWIRKKQGQV